MKINFWEENVIFEQKLLILRLFLEILCQRSEIHLSFHCYIKIDWFGTKIGCQIHNC